MEEETPAFRIKQFERHTGRSCQIRQASSEAPSPSPDDDDDDDADDDDDGNDGDGDGDDDDDIQSVAKSYRRAVKLHPRPLSLLVTAILLARL